jgi:hypothetical protein
VADAWTGDAMAAMLQHRIAQMGRPAAYLKDGGRARQKAVEWRAAQRLASPCLDDSAPAAAGMRTRSSQHHPACERFVAACGRVSGTRKPTLVACVAPPTVRTKARCMHGHRLFPWAEPLRKLSPPGGAKASSSFARLRACMDARPACKDRIKRLRADAQGLLGGQKILQTQGLCHDTLAQCEPLSAAMPSTAVRLACRASLEHQLDIAKTLGLDHVGLPISSDTIASLCGVAKHHGVGQTPDAARLALRLPAFCGAPTPEEAAQVLGVSVTRQQEITGPFTSLTQQRREVRRHPERLERLRLRQGRPHVVLLASPKNRSNHESIVKISKRYAKPCSPQ